MENKKEEKNDLRYSQACITLRKHLNMPDLDENSRRIPCNEGRFCYQEGCPIFVKPKVEEPKEETKNERTWYCDVCGVIVSGDVSAHTKTKFHQVNLKKDNPLGINLEVFEEIDAEKPKKKKKEMSVREFLNIQARVFEKLSWHPEIYEALDNLPSTEILDRLLGKTGLEGVATHVGGDMKLKASPKTKTLFENLEKQFAEEDEKKGKAPPPNYENVGTPEEINRALGLVPPTPNYETVGHLPTGFKITWTDEPFKKQEKKKDGKKTSKK